MGVLANHVPSIEQLKPGLVEVVEDSGSKQFFRTYPNYSLPKGGEVLRAKGRVNADMNILE